MSEKWSEMKVWVRWNLDDQYWMNPENLLLVLREKCPNTKFDAGYLIHPSKDLKDSTYPKIVKHYRKKDRRIDRKIRREAIRNESYY